MMTDYHDVLGVRKNASYLQVLLAFRDRMNEILPDVARMDEDAMVRLEETRKAFGVLSDPESRRKHERGKAAAPAEYMKERNEALQAHLSVLNDDSIEENFRAFIGSRILENFRHMVKLEALFCDESLPEKVRIAAVTTMESEGREQANFYDVKAMADPLSGLISRPYCDLSHETLDLMVGSDFLPEGIRLDAGLSLAAMYFNLDHIEGLDWIIQQDQYPRAVRDRAAAFLKKMKAAEAARKKAPAGGTTAPIELRKLKKR